MECENSKYHIFDITTYENGKKVQPDGKVTVRIPLPDGFGTKNLLVCHVDAENNKVTYIPAKVVGDFVEFSAEHFSDYAVVELSGIVEKVNVNDVELKYKNTAKITPEVTLDGDVKYTVKYESSNPSVATVDKDGWITTFGKGETKITCTVTDTYGNTVKDTCTVTVKFSFGQWLIWILLFGFLWY
ncbi:MAG: Ig-like domain-containing protein [Clostridia bacterium]|nr:Ig-like domain-containing protein [Clostridia bacterium]